LNKKVTNRISEILVPTEEQKERMLSNILDEHKNETAKKRSYMPMKRLKPVLAAATVVFCLITTTAFAASYLGLDIKFINFLNPSSNEQSEYLASGAYVVDKQIKNKNGTLDIKQVIGDSNATLILMDFTAPEETVLDKPHYSFDDMYIDVIGNHGFIGYGIIALEDENINDNKISMVMRINNRDSFMGKKIHLKFTDLQWADTRPGEFTTIVPGEWEARFNLDFRNCSTTYEVNKNVTVYGYEAILKTISISPISVALNLDSKYISDIVGASEDWEAENREVLSLNEHSDIYPITINYNDGTRETTAVLKGLRSMGTDGIWFIKNFENVINYKEIKSITFFDAEIQIPH